MDADVEVLSVSCSCTARMPIPAAIRGGQRLETAQAKEKEKDDGEEMASCSVVTKKPAAGEDMSRPWKVQVVSRKKSTAKKQLGAYLLVNGQYFVGQSKAKHPDYLSNLQDLKNQIEQGQINSVKEAKAALASMAKKLSITG